MFGNAGFVVVQMLPAIASGLLVRRYTARQTAEAAAIRVQLPPSGTTSNVTV